jgi:hypothetical protein
MYLVHRQLRLHRRPHCLRQEDRTQRWAHWSHSTDSSSCRGLACEATIWPSTCSRSKAPYRSYWVSLQFHISAACISTILMKLFRCSSTKVAHIHTQICIVTNEHEKLANMTVKKPHCYLHNKYNILILFRQFLIVETKTKGRAAAAEERERGMIKRIPVDSF